MECTAGALGGILFSGVTHTQAILEFESQQAYDKRRRRVSPLARAMGVHEGESGQVGENSRTSINEIFYDVDDDENDDEDGTLNRKTFLSMELFANRLGKDSM